MTALITEPGLYDLPEADYHADPCPVPSLSRSIAHTMREQSPKHAWMEHPRLNPNYAPKEKKQFDIGDAAHSLLLGKPLWDIVVIDAANWVRKATQQARVDAYEAGKTPLLVGQWAEIQTMAKAARAQLDRHPYASEAFTGGKAEQTLIWREGDVWCRALLDDLPTGGNVFYDYKTTGRSAHPDDWFRSAPDHGYDLQDGFYRRGISAVLDIPNPVFRFVVQETAPPYALTVCEFGGEAREVIESDVADAIELWRWCSNRGAWPGYEALIAYGSLPRWRMNQWEMRKIRQGLAAERGEDLRETMIEWQAPVAALPAPNEEAA
jgi:hypothetical protein